MIKNTGNFIKNRNAFAVGFLFATSSLLFGIWLVAIPAIKERLHFTDGSLGLSLLLSPLGALTGVVLSTKIFSKISAGKWMAWGYIMFAVLMILQVNATNRLMLWVCLYFFGVIGFLNGVSANSTVNSLEKKYNRRMMSTCHGMYSMGGGISTGLTALFFSMDIPSGWQIVIVAVFVTTVIFSNHKYLLAHTTILHSRSGLKLPSLTILGISFICMIVFMAEGCVADWSAVYLKETLHVAVKITGLGYTGFAIAMTIGRLNGDSILSKYGSKRVVITGALLAAAGFSIVAFATSVLPAIAGYILIGFGCCCIVPVLFSAATNIPGVSTVEGYAMVTTGGLIGFLAGPSVIGFISEKINLSAGFALLILLMIMAAFTAWKNKILATTVISKSEEPYDEQIY
jgi:MFS family permease